MTYVSIVETTFVIKTKAPISLHFIKSDTLIYVENIDQASPQLNFLS